jgi:hypothetical protein
LYLYTRLHGIIFQKNEMGGSCSTYRGEKRYIQGFGRGTLRERDHLDGQEVDGRIILKWFIRKWGGGHWTGCVWLRIGTGGGLL